MKHTILASALLLAFGTASAADIPSWVEPSGNATTIENNSAYLSDNDWKGGYFKMTDDELPISSSARITTITENKDLGGKTWLINNSNNNVTGALIKSGAAVNHTGNFYVQGNKDSFWETKAFQIDAGGTFTNERDSVIYARNANAIMVLAGGDSDISYTNKGTIIVEGVGVAMDFAGNKSSSKLISGSITNNGDIFLIGNEDTQKSTVANPLVAVRIGENNGSSDTLTFTNTGNIYADGFTAILVEDETVGSVELSEGSHVEGLVDLNGKSNLTVSNLDSAETIQLADEVNEISVEASTVTFEQGTDKALNIQKLSTTNGSDVDIKLHRVGSGEDKVLTIEKVEGSSVDVGYTGNVSDDLLGGKVSQGNLFYGVSIAKDQPDSVTVDQGLMGDEMVLTKDANGNIVSRVTRTNDLLRSAQDLAITNALMWRSQLTNLTDRMGTLRTTPDAAGVWARYNNGRLDGQGIQHDYNTVELGVDKRIADNVTIGFSFDYTKGDTDLSAGSSDNNTYTVGFYGSYFNESGCFLDTMLKIGRIDADYDFRTSAGKESADYMLTGAIFGIETGHRWNIQNYFIEPQVQLTYSHLRAENYTSSIGRDVKFDDMSSLIGRVGVMAGMQFAENRGSAYVKASYNHDFLGDVEGNYEFNGSVRQFDDELDDNWGEVSLGASYQVTDSVNTFVDVGTGFGGDIDQKWRVNLGARYVF